MHPFVPRKHHSQLKALGFIGGVCLIDKPTTKERIETDLCNSTGINLVQFPENDKDKDCRGVREPWSLDNFTFQILWVDSTYL